MLYNKIYLFSFLKNVFLKGYLDLFSEKRVEF
uniref:Uncharacterized protein n=1 Tax=Anguilla anguilla TaxID=7936 RepID=A0A0E9TJU8_ANGAN